MPRPGSSEHGAAANVYLVLCLQAGIARYGLRLVQILDRNDKSAELRPANFASRGVEKHGDARATASEPYLEGAVTEYAAGFRLGGSGFEGKQIAFGRHLTQLYHMSRNRQQTEIGAIALTK